MHELFHSLAFSQQLLTSFIDPEGYTIPEGMAYELTLLLADLSKILSRKANIRGIDTILLTLEPLITRARIHFNCSSIRGVELENQGTTASRGTHWERRIFFNEVRFDFSLDEQLFL